MKHWLLFSALFLLAVLTRFWGLGEFDISPDESHFIGDAFRLFNNDPFMNARHHPFQHGQPFIGHPFFGQDLMVGLFHVFGPSVWAGRAVMAGANILTIVGVYILGRMWFGKTAGLLAMVLMIFLPLDVRYARDAHLDPLIANGITWSTIALVKLLQTRTILWSVILGLLSAATFTVKINGPVLFLYYLLSTLLLTKLTGCIDFLKTHGRSIIVAGFVFAVTTVLFVDPFSYLDALLHPSDPIANTSILRFFQGGWYHFVWLHLIPHLYTLPFFLLVAFGVAVVIRKYKDARPFLLAWLLVYSHIFLTHNGHSGPYGYMPLNPPFVLFAVAFLTSLSIKARMMLTVLLLVGFLPLTIGNGLRLSVGPFAPTSQFFDSNFLYGQTPYRDAARFLNSDDRQRFSVLWIKDGDRHFPSMDLRDGIHVTPFTSMKEATYGLTADSVWKEQFEQNGFELARTFSFRDDVLYLLRKTT